MPDLAFHEANCIECTTTNRHSIIIIANGMAMPLTLHPTRQETNRSKAETLLWIGSRRHREFIQPYGIAESLAGQVAYRAAVHDAIARPASHVDHIVIARPDSDRPSEDELDELQNQYPTAQVAELTGVCCAAAPALVRLSPKRLVPWHRATQFLTHWLNPSRDPELGSNSLHNRRPSIAVLTSSFVEAEGLLQIADGAGAVGVWCRSADALVARNIDVFWWDDSVTGDRSTKRWDQLLDSVDGSASGDVTHVWLTGAPNHAQIVSARSAGVDHVISKPMRVETLVATLGLAEKNGASASAKAA